MGVVAMVVFTLLSFSFADILHNPEHSSTMLIEQEDGTWVLQVRSALTAFEHEVHTNYGKDCYKTPKEFNAYVIQHLTKNISITTNEKNAVTLQNGKVQLGHETVAVFDVVGMPKEVAKISLTNTGFKDIHANQSALVILKKGFTKQQFILSNQNGYTVQLKAEQNKFVQQ